MNFKNINLNIIISLFVSACKVCPNFGRKHISEESSCHCGTLYFDPDTKACCSYFHCSFFDFINKLKVEENWKDLQNHKDLSVIIKKSVQAMENYKEGNPISEFAKTQALMGLQQILKSKKIYLDLSEIEESADYQFLCDSLASDWKTVSQKHSAQFKSLFNDILMRNRKLEAECHDNKICKFYYVLNKNKVGFGKTIARHIPDLGNTIIENMDLMKENSKSFCKHHHCKFLKKLLKDEGLLKEYVENIIAEKTDFSKTLVDVVLAGRQTLEMYANSRYY